MMGGERAILRILLVRHGLSEDNQNAIWAGHRDSSLTSIGVGQAKALGQALANISFVAIYSSDLERARSTAEEILAANRSTPTPPLVQTQSLREQNFGQAEGKSWSDGEFAYAAAAQSADARTFRFNEGESLEDVNARMGVSLRRYVLPRVEALRAGADRGEPQIVIVSHGIAIAEMLRVLMSMHEDQDGSSPWPNPTIKYKRVRLENTGWTLVELAVPINEADNIATPTATAALSSSSEAGADVVLRKPMYVRIVQQNIIDHLKGPLLPQHANSQSDSQVGQMLSGGLSGPSVSSASGNTSLEKSSPSLALLNLRTVNSYDARQLMRELERAGASTSMLSKFGTGGDAVSAGLQTMAGGMALPNGMQNASAASSAAIANAPGAWSEVWQTICVQILPIFKREQPKAPIEAINVKVSEHIRRSLERSPARALESLSRDLYAFCAAGMISLNQRLEAWSNDEVRLLEGYVDVWKSFYWRILPWLEACFLPLQIDPTLISLSRRGEDNPKSTLRTEPIDIWRAALTVFRDQLIIPRFEKLFSLFLRMHEIESVHLALLANDATKTRSNDDIDEPGGDSEESRMLSPRLSQMVNIIHGVLSNDDNQAAMESLERALRVGQERTATGGIGGSQGGLTATPSSRGAKRAQARQGWLPKSSAKHGTAAVSSEQDLDDTTSAVGKERAFLTALRSPLLNSDAELEEDTDHDPTTAQRDEEDEADMEEIDVYSALRYADGDDTQTQSEMADATYATESARDTSGDDSSANLSMPGDRTFGIAK